MKIEYNGTNIEVNIIGEFKVEEKNYIVTSYADENNNYKIVILQLIKDGSSIKAVNVKEEDIEKVRNAYEEIKNTLMEDEDEE